MIELRQSTARIVRAGSFVDPTDGVTPVAGVTLGAADEAEALKANGAATVDISGFTFAAVTGAGAWYNLSLTASATDTLGELIIVIQEAAAYLPVERKFMVVTQNYWDSKYSTDKLQVDVVEDSVGFALDSTVAKEATKFDPAADTVARVTLADTTTANTDMRGTDSAALAANTALEATVAALRDYNPEVDVLEDTETYAENMRLTRAQGVGELEKPDVNTHVFKGVDGVKTRITGTVDEDGDRTRVVVDGSEP